MRTGKDPTKNVACIERRFPRGEADPDLIRRERSSDHLSQPDHGASAGQPLCERARWRTRRTWPVAGGLHQTLIVPPCRPSPR